MEEKHNQTIEQMSPRFPAFFIAIVWLGAAFGKYVEIVAREVFTTFGDDTRAVCPQVWWCGALFQLLVCLSARKHPGALLRNALGFMMVFWFWFVVYAIFWPIHVDTSIVSGSNMH